MLFLLQLISFVAEERSRRTVYPPGTYTLHMYICITASQHTRTLSFAAEDVFTWTTACPIDEVNTH